MNKYSIIIILFFLAFISACQGNREQNLAKLDELWGYCDNPHRDIRGLDYKICKDKERALGESGKGDQIEPFDLTGFLDRMRNGISNDGVYKPLVNPYLWQGALDVTSPYDIKIADSVGGFIQTEWVYNEKFEDQRCIIKIQITSSEFVSTGLNTKFICENRQNSIWAPDGQEYVNEEKNLTIKILEKSQYYYSSLNSLN